MGLIENLHLEDVAEHGIRIDEADTDVINNQLDNVGSSSHDGIFVEGGRNRVEGNRIDCTGARYGVNDQGGLTFIGRNIMTGTPTLRKFNPGSSTVWTNSSSLPFFYLGALPTAPFTGTLRVPFTQPGRLIAVRFTLGTAPTGASVIVDVHLNGTTIFPTATKPTCPVSTNISQLATPDVEDVANGDYLTFDIDQIGSTVGGSDLQGIVLWEPAL